MLFDQLLKPMEPKLYPEVQNQANFRYQIKWDGVRMLAFGQAKQVRLQNRQLHDRTVQYPELAELTKQLRAKEVIVDGEVIVLDESGRPSFPRVIRRDFATQPVRIKALMQELPVVYAIFDLLYLDGQSLLTLPWEERQDRLTQIFLPAPRFHLTESFQDGESLFSAIQEQQMEGVVAKELGSPYLLGKKSEHWRKVKNLRQDDYVVGGVTLKQGRVSSLLLGAYQGEELIYIGNASSGLTNQDLRLLQENLSDLSIQDSAFKNPPRLAKANRVWMEPLIVVQIKYLEWTEEFKLRAPVILGFRQKDPKACRI